MTKRTLKALREEVERLQLEVQIKQLKDTLSGTETEYWKNQALTAASKQPIVFGMRGNPSKGRVAELQDELQALFGEDQPLTVIPLFQSDTSDTNEDLFAIRP
jgi:hypothetical protein